MNLACSTDEPLVNKYSQSRLPKKSGSPVFSKFLTKRSVKASSSASASVPVDAGFDAGLGVSEARVSFVAVIRTGFGATGGGIFLPVRGSILTEMLAILQDVISVKR